MQALGENSSHLGFYCLKEVRDESSGFSDTEKQNPGGFPGPILGAVFRVAKLSGSRGELQPDGHTWGCRLECSPQLQGAGDHDSGPGKGRRGNRAKSIAGVQGQDQIKGYKKCECKQEMEKE